MGLAQRIETGERVRSSASSDRIVVRRNLDRRIAGAGYGAITALWLGLMLRSGGASPFAVIALSAFTLTGLALAFSRDDLTIDPRVRRLTHVRGLFGWWGPSAYAFADIERLEIEEGGVSRPGCHATGLDDHNWIAVRLVTKSGETIPIWAAEADEAKAPALRAKACAKAEMLSRAMNVSIA